MNILTITSLFASSYELALPRHFNVTIMQKLTIRDLFVNYVFLLDS